MACPTGTAVKHVGWRHLAPLIGIVLFSLSAWVLTREVERAGFAAIARSLTHVSHAALNLKEFDVHLLDAIAWMTSGARSR